MRPTNNYLGPFTSGPAQELPGPLSQGLLIDQPKNLVEFGANPLTPVATASGSSVSDLGTRVNGGAMQTQNLTVVDSGGLWGEMPSDYGTGETIDGLVPSQTKIAYYVGNTPVFAWTTGTSQSPVVGPSSDPVNTGDFIFERTPIWIGYTGGQGTVAFD